jgi:hypothetical protein
MNLASRFTSWKRGWRWSRPNHLGMLLLGIWLIVSGAMQLFHFSFPASGTVLPALAIAAGVVITLDVNTTTLFLCVLLTMGLAAVAYLLR